MNTPSHRRGVAPPQRGLESPRRAAAGFTLLEGMIAFTMLCIAMVGVLSTMVETKALRVATRETMLASQAAQGVLDDMSAQDFAQLFALYNADPADDPGGNGTAPGNAFDVRGLTPRRGDFDGMVGSIEFPGGPGALLESAVDPGLGMPHDLNSDGVIDGNDHSASYTLFPVRVRVEWLSEGGERAIEFTTALADL